MWPVPLRLLPLFPSFLPHGECMRYGLGYKGSKNRIARAICEVLPTGDRLIDLFGGGGAISDCASQMGKWGSVVYSDVDPLIARLCKSFFSGEYSGSKDLYRWVSRDDFYRLRDTDPLVRFCWSFGTNGKDYLYSRAKEPYKEAIHRAIVDGTYSDLFMQMTGGVVPFESKTVLDRYGEWGRFARHNAALFGQRLELCQAILNISPLVCRCEAIERCGNLARTACGVEVLTRSYLEYTYTNGDIVYCDIPYEGTVCGSYTGFDHTAFWKWARRVPCFVSSYTAPPDFEVVWEQDVGVLSATGTHGTATERLFRSPCRGRVCPV